MIFKMVSASLIALLSCTATAQQAQPFAQTVLQLKDSLANESLSKAQIENAFSTVKRVRKSGHKNNVKEQLNVGQFGYLEVYLPHLVNDDLVKSARTFFKDNLALMQALEKKYQVQPRFLVAQWGISNQFASTSYGYDALSILSSLVHAKSEKVTIDDIQSTVQLMTSKAMGDIAITSNWQGKLGLLNMTPGQVLSGYQDYDNDGSVDIWGTTSDALATAAQYLSKQGWDHSQTWGRQIKLPKDFDEALLLDTKYRTLAQWSEMGLIRFDGRALPRAQVQARLTAPDGLNGRIYLTYKNFELLSQLNQSPYDSIAVGYLANRIKFPAIN